MGPVDDFHACGGATLGFMFFRSTTTQVHVNQNQSRGLPGSVDNNCYLARTSKFQIFFFLKLNSTIELAFLIVAV